MPIEHVSDHDLERYYLGMVTEAELIALEEHLLWCHSCVARAEETQSYVDLIRRAIIVGNYDLPQPRSLSDRSRSAGSVYVIPHAGDASAGTDVRGRNPQVGTPGGRTSK